MGELKQEEGMGDAVTELKSLTRGHRIGSNSADNAKIPGSLAGRNANTLIHGEEKKSAADSEICKIKKAISDPTPNQVKMRRIGKKKKYKEINFAKSEKLETRGNNLHLLWGEK